MLKFRNFKTKEVRKPLIIYHSQVEVLFNGDIRVASSRESHDLSWLRFRVVEAGLRALVCGSVVSFVQNLDSVDYISNGRDSRSW